MASNVSSSSKHSPNTIRLVTWACAEHSTAATSRLPTLDPDGLYAASILQARRGATNALGDVRVLLGGPSSLLHGELPCVEDGTTGVILASGVEAIEVYARKLAGRKGERSMLQETSLQRSDSEHVEGQQRRKAICSGLERYIQSELHPLIHQCLFAKTLFAGHTAQVYQSGLGLVSRQSLPGRLRRSLQALYSERGKYTDPSNGLGPVLREANSKRELIDEDRREREDLAQRAGINIRAARKPTGLAREEKEQAGRAFGQLRIVSCAEQILNVVTQVLGSQAFLSGQDKPSLLDLRLFSLLAPLLLPVEAYSALAASPVAKLLRSSFPKLVEHTERVRLLLWPIGTTTAANGRSRADLSDWPTLPGVESPLVGEPISIRVAHSLGRMTSEAYMYSVRLAKRIANADAAPAASTTSKTAAAKGPILTPAEQREARVIAWGRYVWIASAVVGMIGTAFASGLIKVEVVDEDSGFINGEAVAGQQSNDDGVSGTEFRKEDETVDADGEEIDDVVQDDDDDDDDEGDYDEEEEDEEEEEDFDDDDEI